MIRYRTDFDRIMERNRVIAEVIFHIIVMALVIAVTAAFFFCMPNAIDRELQRTSGPLSSVERSVVVARWDAR